VIGRWLIDHGLAPWPRQQPPVLTLRPVDGNEFELVPPHGQRNVLDDGRQTRRLERRERQQIRSLRSTSRYPGSCDGGAIAGSRSRRLSVLASFLSVPL
jgi:hypothetical protein